MNIKTPECWTPEQALMIVEFLQDIQEGIGLVYYVDLMGALKNQCASVNETAEISEFVDDEIPF
jgi:hypothetical protein